MVFSAGECYQITVELSQMPGVSYPPLPIYRLALQCWDSIGTVVVEDVECGANLTGSTVGLENSRNPRGAAHYRFCPNSSGAAKIAACWSRPSTYLAVEGPGVDFSSGNFFSCGETTIDFESGECFKILVGGKSADDIVLAVREVSFNLSVECTNKIPQASKPCPIFMELTNLIPELRSFAEPLTVSGRKGLEKGLKEGLPPGSQLLLPFSTFADVPEVVANLKRNIQERGVHLITFTSKIASSLTGVPLGANTISCGEEQELQLAGGGFEDGPLKVRNPWGYFCVLLGALPLSVDGFYGIDSSAIWTTPFGKGRITSMWIPYGFLSDSDRQLLQSSIGRGCANATTNNATPGPSTPTPIELVCSRQVQGTLSQGSTAGAFSQSYIFCTPEQADAPGEGLRLVMELCAF